MWGQSVGLNLYPPMYGVSHADELFMLFKSHQFPVETVFTDEDKVTSQNMLQMWTDFAKTGNPTPNPEKAGAVEWKRWQYII